MTKSEHVVGASGGQTSTAPTSRFRNPYNFVPAVPLATPADSPLGQHAPVGHDCYRDGYWSGRIGIRIEVMTPLLVPDASHAKPDDKVADHKIFGMRTYVDENGVERPLLPVTSLKGPLRAAYEAITNSRLSVFHGHDAKIGERFPPNTRKKQKTQAPDKLLPATLKPASGFAELSPADRVFGWVRQSTGHQGVSGAWRGQVTIKPIRCQSDSENGFERLTPRKSLAILGSPKVQQGRFYVAKDKSGIKQDDGISKSDARYHEDKGLRGRKVYPHHREMRANEYERVGGRRDNQNRSITAWIKPGTVFETEMEVINLAPAELGALLWLLDLNRWKGIDEGIAHHRLGGGKPLGFGSVMIRVVSLDLSTGEGKQAEYRSLLPQSAEAEADLRRQGHRIDGGLGLDAVVEDADRFDATLHGLAGLVAAFQREISTHYGPTKSPDRQSFLAAPFIAAFLQASRGYPDDLPVHYPRLDPEPKPKGENFKWFVANDKGQKLALGQLVGDKGLPYDPG